VHRVGLPPTPLTRTSKSKLDTEGDGDRYEDKDEMVPDRYAIPFFAVSRGHDHGYLCVAG
jgi:hypothetical protein